jgi:hypothetical protein
MAVILDSVKEKADRRKDWTFFFEKKGKEVIRKK